MNLKHTNQEAGQAHRSGIRAPRGKILAVGGLAVAVVVISCGTISRSLVAPPHIPGATYIGTFNRNLPFGRDVNYPVATATATNGGANILARRPNPCGNTT